ncbi:MAG: hypothetical protein R3F05_01055 [Planctomycetota bacterium]|nr:hypothetical protein [Planctomycetota bacterium]MCB9824683.1 hypothetical protein [Planctomycetota bacterium]MCB9899905.1 hypothetical protein [Planctomycetota bacterium]
MKNVPSLLILALLLLVGALGAAPVRAEDPPVTGGAVEDEAPPATADAEATLAARLQALPAPSPMRGYAFRGYTEMQGVPLDPAPRGVFEITVDVVVENGAPHWRVRETMSVDLTAAGADELRHEAEIVMDQHLMPVRGTWHEHDPDGMDHRMEIVAGAPAGSLRFVPIVGEERGEPRDVKIPGPLVPTLGAFILMQRLALPEGNGLLHAGWSLRGPDEEERFEKVTFAPDVNGRYEGQALYAVDSTRGDDDTMIMWFDKETKALRGAKFASKSKPVSLIVREGKAPAGDAPAKPDLPRGRDEAIDAGMDAALAFGCGDVDLLDSLLYWPSVHAALMKSAPPVDGKDPPTVDELRKRLLMVWRQSLPKNDKDMVQMGLAMVRGSVDVEPDEGSEDGATVVFPEAFQSLRLHVGRYDGKWFLDRLPAPKR